MLREKAYSDIGLKIQIFKTRHVFPVCCLVYVVILNETVKLITGDNR